MSKVFKTVIIILIILAIAFFAYNYFVEEDYNEENEINDEDNLLPVDPDPVDDNKDYFVLQENYTFQIIDPEFNDETLIELTKINDNEYDFVLNMNSTYDSQEMLSEAKFASFFTILLMPDFYANALNKDYLEYNYNEMSQDPDMSLQDSYSVFGMDISNDATLEEFRDIMREHITDITEIPEGSDTEYFLVLQEMFNQNINFRNVELYFNSILEDEVYPEGFFRLEGNEKKIYINFCDMEKQCVSLFEEEEWVYLENYREALNANNPLNDFMME